MLIRTKRVTLTFHHPFSLKGVDRRLAPGKYEVVTDEELVGELMFPAYRRVATMIVLPAAKKSSRRASKRSSWPRQLLRSGMVFACSCTMISSR